VRHLPSGAIGIARDSRSQHENKRQAFSRMANSKEFQRWAHLRASAAQPIRPLLVNYDWKTLQPRW